MLQTDKTEFLAVFGSEMRLSEIWQTLIFTGILAVWSLFIKEWRTLNHTTLAGTRGWIAAVLTVWTIAWILDSGLHAVTPEIADLIWYFASVIALCPPISVLGARRPGNKAWPWFVLLPMMLALAWPVFALWFQGSELRGVQLETPQFAGFLLVLIMGVGNYCGTSFTIAAILYGFAVAASVICVSTVAPAGFADRSLVRPVCVVLMILAAASTKLSMRHGTATRFDRLWFDFFDTFGIVWGRRIQDRMNYLAEKEGLGARLELEGFNWSIVSESPKLPNMPADVATARSANDTIDTADILLPVTQSEARIEHILRWLLRRFVDPPWIDARLGSISEQTITTFVVDS